MTSKQGAQDVISEHDFPLRHASFHFLQVFKKLISLHLPINHILEKRGQIEPPSTQQLDLCGAFAWFLGELEGDALLGTNRPGPSFWEPRVPEHELSSGGSPHLP